jgi:hypothetical protein
VKKVGKMRKKVEKKRKIVKKGTKGQRHTGTEGVESARGGID